MILRHYRWWVLYLVDKISKYLLLLLLLCSYSRAFSQASVGTDEIKVAFIAKFVPYIAWPDQQKDRKRLICFYQAPKFRILFERNIKRQNLPIELCKTWNFADIPRYDIVYLGNYDQTVVAQATATDTLTIAHGPGFGNLGVIINFYIKNNKLRFEINKSVLDRTNLKMSSQLLKLGEIIEWTVNSPKE